MSRISGEELGRIIDAVAWAKTTLVIAIGLQKDLERDPRRASDFRKELHRLSEANDATRILVRQRFESLPEAVKIEIRVCERGLEKLQELLPKS